MRILQVYIHYPVSSGRYYTEAFKRAGHDVRHIGDSTGNQIWGMTVADKYIHQSDGGLDAYWDDWQPDLIILHDTALTGYKHPKYNAPMVVVTQDNHVRDVEQDGVEAYFLAHAHGPAYPVDLARKDHHWLPCASDIMFTPSPIKWEDREYDVCLVGVMYQRRVEVVEALRAEGLKVFTATGLLFEEYRAAYWNARISLCVSAAGDVAQRIFETGRMGCAILTDPLLDFADEYTNQSLHIYGRLTYQNPREAVVFAKDLLGQPQAAYTLGRARTFDNKKSPGEQAALELATHCATETWDARAQVIVDWFEREYGEVESVLNINSAKEINEVQGMIDELVEKKLLELDGDDYILHPIPNPSVPVKDEAPPQNEYWSVEVDGCCYQLCLSEDEAKIYANTFPKTKWIIRRIQIGNLV